MNVEADGEGSGRLRAPGGLGLIQDFVNTLDVEGEEEYLARPGSLATWLETHGLSDGRLSLSDADLTRARALREALRALLLANTGEPLDPAARETFNHIAASVPLAVDLTPAGDGRLTPTGTSLDRALGALLAAAYRAMADGSWVRLKACRAHSCQWAFYDASKNRSGTWCSMAVCGNRNKVRAYQRRRRAGA